MEPEMPGIVFGTSGLGNLYKVLSERSKIEIIGECIKHSPETPFFDTAGKYGAGLALESLGIGLKAAGVNPDEVVISNKLGWLQTNLSTVEPTFEPGVWKDLKHDAIQQISYEGILACYHQGNRLLNGYKAEWVSVHDPDEYLYASNDDTEKRYHDIMEAYRALYELKEAGKVKAVGVGAKDWRVIQKISSDVRLDWIMIANSMTIHSHPAELVRFMEQMQEQGVVIINSAIFNGGFLTGLDYYNYKPVSPASSPELYHWRESMYAICEKFHVRPEVVCVAFGQKAPGVKSIALNTTNVHRVQKNIEMIKLSVPQALWAALVSEGLMDASYAQQYLLD
ncbi:aldo/keto reductase [Arachidicoccus terrestris]|nr:aldo/keto reductase [Arachidicoccus terrestris]